MFKKKTAKETHQRQSVRTVPERRSLLMYHANRAVEQPNASRRAKPFAPPPKSKVKWWNQLPIAIATVAVLVSVIDVLLLSTNPRVVSLATSSNQIFLRPISTYQQA